MSNENYVFEGMWPVLPQPWYFDGPGGIAVDDKGFVYVADRNNNRIQKFTQEGVFVTKWGSEGSGDGQFIYPYGIAVDSSGFVYVVDNNNNRIQKFTPEGLFVTKWGSEGSGDGQFYDPFGIAVDSSGFVYVTDSDNHCIQKFTPEGGFVTKWGSLGSGDAQFSIFGPYGIAVDSSGFVYVTDSHNYRIQKFTPEGGFVTKWGSGGFGEGQFITPEGIAVDSSGFVYVADSYNGCIQKFTPEGGFVTRWCGSGGSENRQVEHPYGIAVDSSGFVYVADIYNDRIQKFTTEGGFVLKWSSGGSGDAQFKFPCGIAVDSSGFVYVADTKYNRIQKFTLDGGFITKWGSYGSGDAQFDYPMGISVDSKGFVYVADSYNHRIQKFTPEGVFVTKWGSEGSGDGQFDYPKGIAVDSSGFVYVADSWNHRIQKFTPEGGFVTKWGSEGSGDAQFQVPCGTAVDSSGFVYVADYGNYRIQKFTPEGQFVTKWGSHGSGDGQFGLYADMLPFIAVDSSGFVYVADTDNCRIQKFTPEGVFVSQWSSPAIFNGPCAIAVDSNEFVFVADPYNHRIQKFTSEGVFVSQWCGDTQFDRPHGIAVDSSGFVFVADSDNHRIQKFTHDGGFITKWGSVDSWYIQFNFPCGIAANSSGFVYVADTYNHRIQKFTPEGVFVSKWGSEGSGDGQFYYPKGIAVDSSGFVYVADTFNHRIQKFTPEGVFVTKWGSRGFGDAQFRYPSGIAVDSSGFVYVADNTYNHRIQKFTHEGGFVTKWGSYGSGDGQFNDPYSIAVDSSGFVYVADTYNHRIQKFTPEGGFITKFGQPGFDPGELNKPYGIAIGPDGKVYVADTYNNRIQVFTKTIPERIQRAIIVAGGGPYPGNNLWDATQMCANFAYRALTSQGFTKDTIYYLSSNTTLDLDNNGLFDDVDSYAETNSLHHGITQWVLDPNNGPVEDVILYLVGHGGKETFHMNPSELLYARDLSVWLNTLQERISCKVILIYDADQSGSFLPHLTSGENRVLITSATPEEPAHFMAQGSLSFSYLFWTHIFNGESVGTAFYLAKEAIRLIAEGQNPLLEDNGNISDPYDGTLSKNTYIGTHTPISDESPVIQRISPEQILEGETKAVIWAEDVTTINPIERVFAVIIPPWYAGEWNYPVIELELIPTGGGRYEGAYEGFSSEGVYNVSIYAMDENGNISLPKKTKIHYYKKNDTRTQATDIVIDGPSQNHNFQDEFDEDWIRFYGIKGVIYSINASHVGDNCDLALELHDTNSPIPLIIRNFGFEGEEELIIWECPHDGVYYLRITNVIPYFGEGTGYTIKVSTPISYIPPNASAGPDQTVNEADTVTLNGSNSNDPDGSIIAYLWTQISGRMITISDSTAIKPTFTAPYVSSEESLIFHLRVTDDQGAQSTDFCVVTVSDSIPNLSPLKPVLSPPVLTTGCQLLLYIPSYYYSDPENDPHSQSHWQISKQASFSNLEFDITSSEHLTELTIPYPELESNTTYYVRVQFSDASLAASDWSDNIEFTTESYKQVWHVTQLWPVLQQMWYFSSPKGIAVDQRGFIYVADTANQRIQKFTADGGFVKQWREWTSWESGNDEFKEPSGIAIDTRGFVYVADAGNHCIQKFTADGGFVKQWGSWGSGEGELDNPAGIAVDSGDFVYVADSGNNRIQKFTADGGFVKQWGSWGSGYVQFKEPSGIVVDAEGFIYIADTGNDRIQKFTQDGIFLARWGSWGSGEGEFDDPAGMAIDSEGFVYVADSDNHRIQKFTQHGNYIAQWGGYGSENGQLKRPSGIAVDGEGSVYVADESNDRIQKFTQKGAFTAEWGISKGLGNGQFNSPLGITMDGRGFLYVTDSDNHRIQKFTQHGDYITQWGGYGSGDRRFWRPSGIAVDEEDFSYVVDSNNHRIQKFTQDGDYITQWGSYGSGNGQLNGPSGIAVDAGGSVYVVDSNNHRIQRFTLDGEYITQWGGYGSGDGQFWRPSSIAVDAGGFVYVTDSDNHRIQRFTLDGDYITQWGSYGSGDGQFWRPSGVAVDAGGFVYVTDSNNHRIQKFTLDGEYIAQFGGFGSDPGELNGPEFLYIDPNCTVYVADTGNHRIQVFKQAFKKVEETRISRAIIVAGGGPYPDNNLWDATQVCANFAYRVLTYRGFTKETIYYLSSDTALDLDNNGEFDDVDAHADLNSLYYSITQWAPDPDGTVEDVILYLVDHGGKEIFRMNPSEFLFADDLGAWLDILQGGITGKVILIIDACHSGSFLPYLISGEDRVLITSTSPEESAYFISQGSLSFSHFFWTHILNGESIGTAFDRAKEAIRYTKDEQNPFIEDNGNLSDPNDGILVKNTYIGMYTPISGESPVIQSISPNQTINGTTSATLYASGVKDKDGIARVWAVIRPPNYRQVFSLSPVLELPSLELKIVDPNNPIDPNIPFEPNTYAGIYDQFNLTGTYYIVIYARDRAGNTSLPSEVIRISVDTPLKRRAIIVAGGSEDPEALSLTAIEKNASFAYRALLVQGYTNEDIHLMTTEGTVLPQDPFTPFSLDTNDVDTNASSWNLEEAITIWAGQNTQDLVLYLVGEGNKDTFRINQEETLDAQDLDSWIDHIQDRNTPVTLIYDASYSGDFISKLIPPPGKQRILISSTSPGEHAHFLFEGDLSFSALFWPYVINGANLRDAFIYPYDALGISFNHTQVPVIDDTGDGLYTWGEDGRIAREYTIGTGIMLAGDAPLIGSVSPEQILEWETKAIIWARDITATNRIERVFAVIIPPWYAGEGSDPLIELELLPTGEGSYEGAYEGFSSEGIYNVSLYAMDENGNISLPKKTRVYRYDGNNSRSQATPIFATPQRHNFHDEDDEHWFMFVGIEGKIYSIDVDNVGDKCDPALELYDTNSLDPLIERNFGFEGEGESMSWECPHYGIYYIRVTNVTPYFGEGTEYTITVHYPEGELFCIIRGKIRDAHWGFNIEKIHIETSGEYSGIPGLPVSSNDGSYLLFHTREACTVTASASGYKSKNEDISYSEFMNNNTIVRDFDLEPDPNNPSILLSHGLNLFACPFNAPLGYASSDLARYLGKQEGISTVKILRYNPPTGTYEGTALDHSGFLHNGFPYGKDFSIKNGEGYLLYMEMENKMKMRIVPPCVQTSSLSLEKGINIISLPCIPPGYTSYDLLLYLGSQNDIWSILRFNKEKGAFEKTYYTFGRPSGDEYEIVRDEGYIVHMKTKKQVECPK